MNGTVLLSIDFSFQLSDCSVSDVQWRHTLLCVILPFLTALSEFMGISKAQRHGLLSCFGGKRRLCSTPVQRASLSVGWDRDGQVLLLLGRIRWGLWLGRAKTSVQHAPQHCWLCAEWEQSNRLYLLILIPFFLYVCVSSAWQEESMGHVLSLPRPFFHSCWSRHASAKPVCQSTKTGTAQSKLPNS